MKIGMLSNPHRNACLATAAVMLVVALWRSEVGNKPNPPVIAAADRPQRAATIEAPAAAARSGFDELPTRAFPAAAGKLFWAPSLEPKAPRPQPLAPDPAGPSAELRAPPLPFTYLGRIRSGGATTVFLARETRESVARVGDILDNTYRVEKIDETRMVFVYLPLGTQQSLPLAGEGAMARSLQPGGSTAQTPGAQDSASLLQLDAPEQVSTGQEFVVNLSLLAGRRASVGVVYDPNVLSAIRRPAPGESTLSDRGRVLVDVVGPGFAGGQAAPAAVRFRVIGAAPATTQIQLEDLTTTHDSDLASLNVPAPRRIFVSSASGTR
jgi:hypothetical protein